LILKPAVGDLPEDPVPLEPPEVVVAVEPPVVICGRIFLPRKRAAMPTTIRPRNVRRPMFFSPACGTPPCCSSKLTTPIIAVCSEFETEPDDDRYDR
jgi:hypothetical protein